jgi:hypothetical protein
MSVAEKPRKPARSTFPALLGLALVLATVACTHGRSFSSPGGKLPPPRYSAEEIGGMFERPTTVAELLRNLKIAVDGDLVAEPGFGSDANLLKFFNGSAVRHEAVGPTGLDFNQQDAVVSITADNFPQMTVQLRQGLVSIEGANDAAGHVSTHVKRFGYIQMSVAAVPEFTVKAVRGVFGKETEAQIGGEWASDGGVAPRTAKGNLIYRYTEESVHALAPTEQKGVMFVIQLPKPGSQDYSAPFSRAARMVHDTDAIDGLFIYVPGP